MLEICINNSTVLPLAECECALLALLRIIELVKIIMHMQSPLDFLIYSVYIRKIVCKCMIH